MNSQVTYSIQGGRGKNFFLSEVESHFYEVGVGLGAKELKRNAKQIFISL